MLNLDAILQEHLNLKLTAGQIEAFEIYKKLLLEWNQKFNLTSITDPDEIHIKHFFDSLTCLKFITDDAPSVIDIGCGAGFPGIPLKIMRPEMSLVLVESVRKKTDFCRAAVEALGLTDVSVIHARAEDVGRDPLHREKYDWAVARAVAPLPILAEYLLPLVRLNGYMLSQKSANIEEELAQSTKAIAILGGARAETESFSLPVNYGTRTLVKIKKEKYTPSKYPRKAGFPSKKPLY